MTPDFEKAAIKATETLIKFHVNSAPVLPLPILKSIPGVLVVSYAEAAESIGIERKNLVTLFGIENQDAATFVQEISGRLCYFVVYNQRLPFYMLQRSLARELGHIILGHDGSRPDEVRQAEAVAFARHLLCPRALVRALTDAGLSVTVEMLGNVTGCFERCLSGIRKTPGVLVPAGLNRQVRDLFADYVHNFVNFQAVVSGDDESPVADFGTFMDLYEE